MDKEQIGKFINSVIKNNNEDMATSARSFSIGKVRSIISEYKAERVAKLYESLQVLLLENNQRTGMHMEMEPHTGIIKVNGKPVGRVETNMDDFESGINFISADGRFSKEFNTVEELNRYLYTTYGAV